MWGYSHPYLHGFCLHLVGTKSYETKGCDYTHLTEFKAASYMKSLNICIGLMALARKHELRVAQ